MDLKAKLSNKDIFINELYRCFSEREKDVLLDFTKEIVCRLLDDLGCEIPTIISAKIGKTNTNSEVVMEWVWYSTAGKVKDYYSIVMYVFYSINNVLSINIISKHFLSKFYRSPNFQLSKPYDTEFYVSSRYPSTTTEDTEEFYTAIYNEIKASTNIIKELKMVDTPNKNE